MKKTLSRRTLSTLQALILEECVELVQKYTIQTIIIQQDNNITWEAVIYYCCKE